MFNNIGNKVCGVAKFCGFLGLIAMIIGGLMLIFAIMDGEDFLLFTSPIVMASGLVCIISSWPLYAFGQITNDVREIKNKMNSAKISANELPNLD